jgi:phosphatidylserine decarboxylase
MGRFNMGSTVILLYGRDRVDWLDDLQAGGTVQLGDVLGRIRR